MGVLPALPQDMFKGFYSNLFTVPKPNSGISSILDLKSLNKLLQNPEFCMKSARWVIALRKEEICGHPISLSACSYLPTSSALFALHSGRQPFPVCHTALRPIFCSQSVFKGLSTFDCPSQNSEHPSYRLSRLPSSEELLFLSVNRKCPQDNSATPGLWLGDQFQQICPLAGILGSGPRTHPKQMSFSQKIKFFLLRAHAREQRSRNGIKRVLCLILASFKTVQFTQFYSQIL